MMMISNDFFQKNNLKNKATSNIKSYQVLSSIGLDNVVNCLRDGPFESNIGFAYLQQKN